MALGEVLTFFGIVADYAAGASPEQGERIAALVTSMAKLAQFTTEEIDALYFAARLRNIGALGNAAFGKGEPLSEREQITLRWDVPSDGARICEHIGALPAGCADIVRWQAECWDGTGYPDSLRWSGIPRSAQMLHLAAMYVAYADPEEALSEISSQAGRAFAPEHVRTFFMWFHTTGGEVEAVHAPYAALAAERTAVTDVIESLSQRVDRHNGTPGRARRIAAQAQEVVRGMQFDEEVLRKVTLSALLFGIGELRAEEMESEQFDPLGRLGIEGRAQHAVTAASLVAQCASLAELAPVLRARAEWYDGTGAPDCLRHDAIPAAAQVLAACVAYDAIDQAYRSRVTEERALPTTRLETAAGTQFDPHVVRALCEVVKAHA